MDLQRYFQSYQNYFWEWENESQSTDTVFESVTIPHGNTIAYGVYVMETLEYLAVESIPPFGSFLLAVIATNPGAKTALENIFKDLQLTFCSNTTDSTYKTNQKAHLFLNNLMALPEEYKKGNKRKQVFQAVFSGCHNRISSDNAKTILIEYRQNGRKLIACSTKIPTSQSIFQKDIRTLELLYDSFPDTESILQKIKGIPNLPEETLVEELVEDLPTGENDFIKGLIENPLTFQLGSLIKRLWSGFTFTLHHFGSGRQPLGGIADLSNKGDFDKLMISEFANDDEVFMSRLANNEALYIERELPPEDDKFIRIILIDTSLKNWGTPKVLAYATAIAIATHPKTNIECRIFTIGENYNEVIYTTVDDVINGLNSLSPKLDAAKGLEAFLASDLMSSKPEVFIISSTAALKSFKTQKTINEHYDEIKFIIEPDFLGNLNFYKIQNKSRKLVQHLQLPLDILWKNGPTGQNINSNPTNQNLKQYNFPSYPLLYPLRSGEIARFYFDGYIYMLTSNRSLLQTYTDSKSAHDRSDYKGCKLLLENLSVKSGGIHTLGKDGENYILISYYQKDNLVSYLNLNTSEYHKIKLELRQNDNYKIYYDYKKGQPNNTASLFNPVLNEFYKISKVGSKVITDSIPYSKEIATEYNIAFHKTEKFSYKPGSNVLQNYLPVCIDTNKKLRLNKHQLNIYLQAQEETDCIKLTINQNHKPLIQSVYNSKENINKFVFPDGSEILRDKRGILTLKSNNMAIPTIYVPVSLEYSLGVATDTEFAGNDYFYNDKDGIGLKKISIREFDDKYIKPFIQNIIDYGA